jgi:hypothetical protein
MSMGVNKRIFWIVTLGAFVSGCAGQRYTASPDTAADRTPAGLEASVERGSRVKVVLLSDEIIEGEVSWVTATEVAIRQVDEIATKERIVEAQEIARIEVAEGTKPGYYVLGMLVGAGIVYAIVEGFKGWSMFGN